MKHFYITLVVYFSLVVVNIQAQQTQLLNRYDAHLVSINPAYAGSEGSLSVTLFKRNQWLQLEGAPKIHALFADIPFYDDKMGAGLSVVHDQIGPFSNLHVMANYAYRFSFGSNKFASRGRRKSSRFKRSRGGQSDYFALGLNVGFNNYRSGINKILVFDKDDPIFSTQSLNTLSPNFGVGGAFKTSLFFGGISISNIIPSKIDPTNSSSSGITNFHLLGNFGIVIPVSEAVTVSPLFLVRYTAGSPAQFDGALNFDLLGRVVMGGKFRSRDQVSVYLEVKMPLGISVGYSYDFDNNPLTRLAHNGSHELFLKYTKGGSRSRRGRSRTPKFRR